MKAVKKSLWIVIVGALLLMNSCGGSENPLADPLKAKPDARLAGIWRLDDGDRVEYCHAGRAGDKLPPGVMRTVSIVHNPDGTIGRPNETLVFSTTIGEKNYLNVICPKKIQDLAQLEEQGWKPELIQGYCLVKYEVKGDTLDIWIMDAGAQRRVVKSGKIKGTLQGDKGATFTDTTENLAALMAAPEGETLFDKEPSMRYKRVK